MNTYGIVMTAVTEFTVTVVALIFGGRWLDQHFGKNLFMPAGAVLGFGLGIFLLVKRLGKLGQNGDSDKNATPPGPQ